MSGKSEAGVAVRPLFPLFLSQFPSQMQTQTQEQKEMLSGGG